MNILDEIKYTFNKNNNAVRKIILANVAVFLVIAIVNIVIYFAKIDKEVLDHALNYFRLPANLGTFLRQPWSIITTMFLHEGVFHILFNMLVLFWIGNILHEYIGNRKVYEAFFGGGVLGSITYMLCYNLLPVFEPYVPYAYIEGASGGVLAVIAATATLLPNYPIHLMLFGEVRLKYIALILLAMDLVNIPLENPGGHIAHIGGALFGFIYIKYLYQDKHLLPAWLRNLFTRKSKMKVHYRGTGHTKTEPEETPSQEEVDMILDKVYKSGYDSLSKKEKETLFKASNK